MFGNFKTNLAAAFLLSSAGASYAQSVPYWGTLTASPGVMDAAWCLTKDRNREIIKKSMNNGTCASDVTMYPSIAVMTEHAVGRTAIALACSRANISGFPAGDAGAINMLRICQCHNTGSQAKILQNRHAVLAALRSWGGC